jgi:hypothetical protein
MYGWERLFGADVIPVGSWEWLYLSLPAFALGVVLRRHEPAVDRPQTCTQGRRAGNVATVVVLTLTLVHFGRAGVAAISSGVETSRFDFSASGLGGIPSRAVLFSLPVLVLAVTCRPDLVSPVARRAAWTVFVLSRLALGFKGGLFEAAVLLLLAFFISQKRLSLRYAVSGVAIVLAALGYSAWIGARYSTIQGSGGVTLDYYVERLTSQSARPGWALLNLGREQFVGSSAWTQDVMYFFGKYFDRSTGVNFASDQIVSSVITNTPRSSTSFLVPVTTGGAPYLTASFGIVAATLVLFSLGYLWSVAEGFIRMSEYEVIPFAGAALLLAIQVGISNGGLVYLLINESAGLMILIGPLYIARHAQSMHRVGIENV